MKHIPNLITASNLLLGCLAAVRLWEGVYEQALLFFVLALLMDWLDGFMAYLLRAQSEIGKQLDSLADMITFGFLPGLLWYVLLAETPWANIAWLGFIYTAAAALRLARFNIEEHSGTNFSGLPSPAAAIFSLGYFYWWEADVLALHTLLQHPAMTGLFLLIPSFLMISRLPMFSLKIKRFTWEGNAIKFIFVLIAIPILLLGKGAALLPLMLLYILWALVLWLWGDKISN